MFHRQGSVPCRDAQAHESFGQLVCRVASPAIWSDRERSRSAHSGKGGIRTPGLKSETISIFTLVTLSVRTPMFILEVMELMVNLSRFAIREAELPHRRCTPLFLFTSKTAVLGYVHAYLLQVLTRAPLCAFPHGVETAKRRNSEWHTVNS
jgi:hypothetical protein